MRQVSFTLLSVGYVQALVGKYERNSHWEHIVHGLVEKPVPESHAPLDKDWKPLKSEAIAVKRIVQVLLMAKILLSRFLF